MTATEIKERPILFSTTMVKAILAGRKTVTRRVINPQPLPCNHAAYTEAEWRNDPANWKCFDDNPDEWYCTLCGNGVDYEGNGMKCRHGKPGDVLWVRETWGKYAVPDCVGGVSVKYRYKADDIDECYQWKPSIHMPKFACRLRLEILSVRVERLHDITEEDAIREGIKELLQSRAQMTENGRAFKDYLVKPEMFNEPLKPKKSFETLWQSINGKESWDANPWVWRIEFKKI